MTRKVVTFGEIMLRLSPPTHLRVGQTRSFDAIYAGAEANVAITLANFGMQADFVSRLPQNELGDACLSYLRQFGVGTDKIIRGGKRLGIYFLELGASQRGNKVIYDRENSSFATLDKTMVDWKKNLSDANWFHWTGITPPLSCGTAEACMEAARKAKQMGLTVSCDLNYRSQLWEHYEKPADIMANLLRYVDILIGNEEDAEKFFGIKAPETDVEKGDIKAENYVYVAKKLMNRFSNIRLVNLTLRGSISASHNTWSGVAYDGSNLYVAPTYDIVPIIDRVGTGDCFAGSLIFGLQTYNMDLQKALNFAVAASCLKHTIYGDSSLISLEEVKRLLEGKASGRILR